MGGRGYPDTLEAVEKQYRQDNCRSKSEFIEKAVHFYVGYICSADKSDYLPHNVLYNPQLGWCQFPHLFRQQQMIFIDDIAC